MTSTSHVPAREAGPGTPGRRRRRPTAHALQRRHGLAFIAPAAVFMGLLIAYPLVYGLYISVFDTNLVNRWDFVGAQYYERAVTSEQFQSSILVTGLYAILVVAGTHVVGMLLALALNRRGLAVTIFRIVFILPWLFPEVVVALLWRWILNPVYGVLNDLLLSIGVIDAPQAWLEDARLALLGVVGASIWTSFPLVMILLLAGLQSISPDLYEAASLDGAGRMKSFVHITVPGLLPVLLVTLILQTVWWFKHFTIVWLMTGGGPVAATSVVSISIYREAFQNFNFGQAAAYAAIVFAICLAASALYRRVIRDEG